MTKIGIIGCGSISRFHYEGYEKAGARIAHVCDIRLDAAQKVADRYGARATDDYHTLLADPEIDLVSVCAIASAHKEICLAALAAGKGVVCEKTLTDNPADSADIARAADRAGLFCATAFMKNFFPAVIQAKKLLATMGPVVSIHARTWQPFGAFWENPLPGFLLENPSPTKRGYGGGVLVCGGSHILNLVCGFAGRPTRVCGRLAFMQGADVDHQANAMLWLKDGGIAHLECLWHPFSRVGYERNGWDERLEINTAKGRLDLFTPLWCEPEKNGALLVHQDAATGVTTEYRYPAINAFHAEMAEMVRRFEADERPMPSAWDGYVVDELIAQITKSSETGSVVDMKYRDE